MPTVVDGLPLDDARTAMAWAYGRHGTAPDAVGAAALMLVGHDLMGAQYPSGRLDVDTFTEAALSGFGADGPAVLARARAIKADALAHGHLAPPWRLQIVAIGTEVGGHGIVSAVVQAGDELVAGIEVTLRGEGVVLQNPGGSITGADGAVHAGYVVPAGAHRFTADATVADLVLQSFAPTAAPAQRVARPATQHLATSLDRPAAPTTTTSTATTSTSTSRPRPRPPWRRRPPPPRRRPPRRR